MTVINRESLDELEALVRGLFEAIVDKNATPPVYPDLPYDDRIKKHYVKVSHILHSCIFYIKFQVVPVKELRSLQITFSIPDFTSVFGAKVSAVVLHLTISYDSRTAFSLSVSFGWA